jgi:methylenetetrahydrofolate--tRNA-(uracil-5-)-methyltransferase
MTTQNDNKIIHVIGGGLAGSEAAWQIANANVNVVLHEMRPVRTTDAHRTDSLAELVCSNSSAPTTQPTTRSACCMPNCAG